MTDRPTDGCSPLSRWLAGRLAGLAVAESIRAAQAGFPHPAGKGKFSHHTSSFEAA